MKTMKIFEFDWNKGDVKDWIFAPNIKEAKKFYLSHTGNNDFDGYDITEVSDSDLDSKYILDINETEPDMDEVEYNEDDYLYGYKIEMTFREYIEKNTLTDIVCTTEF